MALFGKKKKAEPTVSPAAEQEELQIVGGDTDEAEMVDDGDGQVIDFDAIADELGDDDGESAIGTPLDDAPATAPATAATAPDDFSSVANFDSDNSGLDADDDLDFNAVFDEGTPAAATDAPDANLATDEAFISDTNPFGASSTDFADAEPANMASMGGGIPIEPTADTPPLTYTAPLLTSDAVATAGVPATRKSLPLPMILGALGLLLALGAAGYLATRGNDSTPAETPIVATNPPLQASAETANLVAMGASVDGVPIAPGAIAGTTRALGAPVGSALGAPRPTVDLTPQLLNELKILWKRGAAAKQKGDIAGARAAWTEMLRRRPNHPNVQSAIDKLPTA